MIITLIIRGYLCSYLDHFCSKTWESVCISAKIILSMSYHILSRQNTTRWSYYCRKTSTWERWTQQKNCKEEYKNYEDGKLYHETERSARESYQRKSRMRQKNIGEKKREVMRLKLKTPREIIGPKDILEMRRLKA